ncbi:unnamed protein product [Adineta steineri]|uniref:G-protein coupled receptors family 1 profile domain-containing protein n=1 Tax=Adineta steineri TaxID=433720 RepID=A0A816A3Q4_9BILA|nr:unnamed protein product [Adineta steineri]CAF1590050.1 unnamed protein product [Adineta steineri]
MVGKFPVSLPFPEDSLSSPAYLTFLTMQCERILSLVGNKTAAAGGQEVLPVFFQELLARANLTLRVPKKMDDCILQIQNLNNKNSINKSEESNTKIYDIEEYTPSLLVFVILIGIVSLISIIGNICLAKVLYSKRFRLIQTDRIVLCLALSELCLVIIDSPTEIYRFISSSFTQEWLCRFHTFFEALFSTCIIFYHLLGAFDRFVYIHGHTSSRTSSWSKWCRRVSTKSGSIILLILPIICSLPLAICNMLHANILPKYFTKKSCIVQYTNKILISVLISFYILPIFLAFFLHAKLIYFIRSRHNQRYLTKRAYILPTKRNNTAETHVQKRSNKHNVLSHEHLHLTPKQSSHRRLVLSNSETAGSTATTITMGAAQLTPLNSNPNNSSQSSQSSRSSTATSSTSISSPIILYQINSQANANANRTVLLLVLLLSFYVLCWAPYNIYTWHHVYQITPRSLSPLNRTINPFAVSSSSNEHNQTLSILTLNNRNTDLRRFIFINYSLYLLSMISMCFSFIFYFALNKQARQQFSHLIGCICPWTVSRQNEQKRQNFLKEDHNAIRRLNYRGRYHTQYPYLDERVKRARPLLLNDRYNHTKKQAYPQNGASKRMVLNYGCQVQCCP